MTDVLKALAAIIYALRLRNYQEFQDYDLIALDSIDAAKKFIINVENVEAIDRGTKKC
jgi:hypothetical protein